jgi:hypothetical protein
VSCRRGRDIVLGTRVNSELVQAFSKKLRWMRFSWGLGGGHSIEICNRETSNSMEEKEMQYLKWMLNAYRAKWREKTRFASRKHIDAASATTALLPKAGELRAHLCISLMKFFRLRWILCWWLEKVDGREG